MLFEISGLADVEVDVDVEIEVYIHIIVVFIVGGGGGGASIVLVLTLMMTTHSQFLLFFCLFVFSHYLWPGLQCKGLKTMLTEELDKWHAVGVEGHFEGKRPWVTIDEICVDSMAKIVGAKPIEICLMNTLSANLHSLMVSFYRPEKASTTSTSTTTTTTTTTSTAVTTTTTSTNKNNAKKVRRYKILCEAKSFPSDKFVFESQIRLHGLDPADALIEMRPRPGESTLRTEDILAVLEKEGPSIACCLFSGVQYYTGQYFQCRQITQAAKV